MTTTQRELRQYVATGMAYDITLYSCSQVDALRRMHHLDTLAVSYGVYGINGALLRDETGTLYVIIGRAGALFQLV